MTEAAQPSSAVQAGPYKFLDHFGDNEEDRRRFAGRDLEIRELVTLITNGAVLVLYGRSGTGKTSLILAGVFPRLRERGYTPVYVRTLVDPLRDLYEAITRQCGLGDGRPGGEAGCDLRAVAGRAAETGSVAVVIDQFEEFFIRFREKPELRAELISAVADIVNDQDLDVTIVFSLREEYLAALDDLADKLPNLFESRYRLRALSAFGVRQAISRPLLDSDIPYEESVVSKLVDQLDEFGFDPAVVQIICSELYKEAARRAQGKTLRITEEDLSQVGGLDGIFKRYLDGATVGIPERLQLLARIVLDALITRESTKRAATVEDLLHSRFTASREDVEEVLALLTEQRLLRRQVRDEAWYELMHERLIEYIEDWLNLDPDFLTFRQARVFVCNNCVGELWRKKPDTLLNAEVLDGLLAPYLDRFRFEPGETEFVLRSAVYRCSPIVAFWAGRHGHEGTVALLQELAASPRPAERTGAATAVGRLTDPDSRLTELCLNLVVQDAELQVRRAAGLALAGRAGPEELRTLRLALLQKETRKHALEAFAYLREGGHPLRELNPVYRWSAKWKAERHVFREKRDAIRFRSGMGALEGALGGLAWAASAGALVSVAAASLESSSFTPLEWIREVLKLMGWLAAGGVLTGFTLGGIAAGAAAKDATVRGEGHWFRAALRIRAFWATLALGTGCTVIDYVPFGLTLIATSLLLPVVLGGVAFLSRPAVWSGHRRLSHLLWSLLSSLGPPILLLLILAALLSAPPRPTLENTAPLVYYFAIFLSCATCVMVFAIARTAQPSSQAPSTASRRRSRAAILLSALLVPAWFAFFYGFDTVPPLAHDQDLAQLLSWTPGPGFPDGRYIRLRNPTAQPQIWEVTPLAGPGDLKLVGVNAYLAPATRIFPLFLPPGDHLVRFYAESPQEETILRLRRLQAAPPASGPILLSRGQGTTILLPLTREWDGWHGTLRGIVDNLGTSEWAPTVQIHAASFEPVKVSAAGEPAGQAVELRPVYGPFSYSDLPWIEVAKDGRWARELVVSRIDEKPRFEKPPLVQIEININ